MQTNIWGEKVDQTLPGNGAGFQEENSTRNKKNT
jgi:hypothetical protein